MGFSTNIFIFCFLPIVLIISALISKVSHKSLKLVLLFFSYLFSFWLGKETFIFIIFVSLLLYIYSLSNNKKPYLFIAAVPIFFSFFKFVSYINVENLYIDKILTLQPVALSFVSLSSISYCVDLYKDESNYKPSFVDTSLYISFFPKYISGPVVSWTNFKDQLCNVKLSIDNITDGLIMFIKGLSYKVIIADVLYSSIQPIINYYTNYNSLFLILTILVYSFVIYFDFMGYSQMSIGISKIFGFVFDQNFNLPYISYSLNEFYRRWHISLGNFFKKYVYIPLGGNKKNIYINIFIVMTLSGIWHGNGFAYLLWGIITGLIMMIERKYIIKKKRISIIINYLIVSILWMPFMLGSFKIIVDYITCIFANNQIYSLYNIDYYFNRRTITILIIAIVLSFTNLSRIEELLKKNAIIYYTFFAVLLITCIMFIFNQTYAPFIYFRF